MKIWAMSQVVERTSSRTNRRSGFTLLELLIVVAILAIVGGGLIVAYEGLETQSARGAGSHGIAAVDSAVRLFTNAQGAAPSNFDSLLSVTFSAPTVATPGSGALSQILPATITGKLAPAALTTDQFNSLTNAGITSVRHIDVAGEGTGGSLTILAQDGTAATVGPLAQIDIPNRAFDTPRPGANRNRGRGAQVTLVDGGDVTLWLPGAGGINNVKVGAAADDVLIAFGLGNSSTIVVQNNPNQSASVQMAQAPNYVGRTPRDKYSRYILLYNVGSVAVPRNRAKLQAVIDTNGDFMDEELSEFTGQKP